MSNNGYVINENIDNFLLANDIDPNVIASSDQLKNYLSSDINTIISNYGIVDDHFIKRDVCIRDIVGFEPIRCRGKYDLKYVLNETYACDTTRTYAIRNNDKLQLPKDVMIERIKKSIENGGEKICLDYIDDGKYVVSTNGCHRISILRLLYIAESFGKTEEEQRLIDEKYTLSCEIKTYDYDVTYINFILSYCSVIKDMFRTFDEHYNYCDNYIVRDYSDNKFNYTKQELINYFLNFVNSEEFMKNEWVCQMLVLNAKRYESLYNFIEKYIPNLVPLIEKDVNDEARRS